MITPRILPWLHKAFLSWGARIARTCTRNRIVADTSASLLTLGGAATLHGRVQRAFAIWSREGESTTPTTTYFSVMKALMSAWTKIRQFGNTNIMVITPDEGASLARALGAHWIVLMRRHGATVVGTNVRECVFRSIYSNRNAELQWKSQLLGKLEPLNQIEAEKAGPHNLKPIPMARAWEYWTQRLEKADELPARS